MEFLGKILVHSQLQILHAVRHIELPVLDPIECAPCFVPQATPIVVEFFKMADAFKKNEFREQIGVISESLSAVFEHF